MSKFDHRARTWDENPMHVERAKAIAAQMEEMIPINNSMNALEFGAGTGLLSFVLQEKLNSIMMVDNSLEMVKVMEEKVAQLGVEHLVPKCMNLETETTPLSFDLIINQMVLHHIPNITPILEKFYSMIAPGGYLAVADLYAEDGSFHGKDFDGHLGFDPESLKELLLKMGFSEVHYQECYQVRRQLEEGATKSFPMFLLVASK